MTYPPSRASEPFSSSTKHAGDDLKIIINMKGLFMGLEVIKDGPCGHMRFIIGSSNTVPKM